MAPTLDHALIGAALTRAITPEQINDNRGAGPLQRTALVRNIDEEARTVEVAFSSEAPVSRWFGDEILDHGAGAMVADRLDDGAAVLWNHDTDVQIGVVDSARIDSDRRGRAVLRFGNSTRASEIWADVAAGVIRHVSVGYFVRDIRIEQREGQPDEVTVTRWEPYEISLVSVPADPSVGVGRALGNPPEAAPAPAANTGANGDGADAAVVSDNRSEHGAASMKTKILRNAAGALVRAKVDEDGNIVEEIEILMTADEVRAQGEPAAREAQERAARLLELGEQYGDMTGAAAAVRDGTSVADYTRSLVDTVAQRAAATPRAGGGSRALADDHGEIGMTNSEVESYSFIRAVRALLNPTDRHAQEAAAFEFEASRAAEQATGRAAQGVMVPVDVLSRALNTSTSGAAAGDTGGFLVSTDLAAQSFIEMTRNRSVLLGMATPLGGLVGTLDIPKQTGSGNVFWVGEDQDVGEGAMELGNVILSPKTIGVFGNVTRRMILQASLDVELMFRASLARDLALGIDHAGFYGAGGATQPLGLKNLTGVNAVDFVATNPTWAELIQMETEVAADNADVESMAYIGNAKFRGHCKSTEKFAGSSGQPIWGDDNTVNGYRAEVTNQTADGDVFFGNFADVLMGMWGGLDLVIDPYTQARSGTRRVVMHQDVDIQYRRAESFTYGANITP